VLATPAPETAPINTAVIAQLVRRARRSPRRSSRPDSGRREGDGGEHRRAPRDDHGRQPEGKLDEPALQATAGFLADVFERSAVRVA